MKKYENIFYKIQHYLLYLNILMFPVCYYVFNINLQRLENSPYVSSLFQLSYIRISHILFAISIFLTYYIVKTIKSSIRQEDDLLTYLKLILVVSSIMALLINFFIALPPTMITMYSINYNIVMPVVILFSSLFFFASKRSLSLFLKIHLICAFLLNVILIILINNDFMNTGSRINAILYGMIGMFVNSSFLLFTSLSLRNLNKENVLYRYLLISSLVIVAVEVINTVAFVISINQFLANGQIPANYELRNIMTFIISIGYFVPFILISRGALLHKQSQQMQT